MRDGPFPQKSRSNALGVLSNAIDLLTIIRKACIQVLQMLRCFPRGSHAESAQRLRIYLEAYPNSTSNIALKTSCF